VARIAPPPAFSMEAMNGLADVLALVAKVSEADLGPDRTLWSGPHKMAWIFHVVGVILWVGGLLLMNRRLGYLMKAASDPSMQAAFPKLIAMEKRMHKLVIIPGFLLTILAGLHSLMAYNQASLSMGWFHAKMTIAVIFLGLQVFTVKKLGEMERNPPKAYTPIYTIIHGISGLLLLAVLFLIRFRPF